LESPIQLAEQFAQRYGVIVLLKGSTTIVTNGSDTYLTTTGCPGMATAGSGDVLSGAILGLLGYLPCSAKTVAVGSYITGLAGEMAEQNTNSISMCASDTVSHLPHAIRCLLERKQA
jgi:NAD(P)H-hydrate epimerase